LRKIRDLLDKAAVDAGRRPGDVHLLAVSKKQPFDRIIEVAAAGHRDFGENMVQEGIDKVTKLAEKTRPGSSPSTSIGYIRSTG
jgi:uncharacterized pyridoxal phosphate-containing UPF0001 family protein